GRKIAQTDDDEGITLVQMGAQNQGRHDHEMEVDFEFTTAKDVSTANCDVDAKDLVYIRRSVVKRKDKGKAIIEESEPTQTKTKVQQEQERLGFEEAQRLQEQFDEEERQRIASIHEEASTFKPEEWDNIQAQIEVDEELAHSTNSISTSSSFADDSSKQGRILSDAEVQEKASNETELVIQDVTPTEVIQDQESSEKGSAEVSTAGAKKGTASEEVPIVSTAEVNLSTAGGTVTYTRRSAEKRSRQDKGKAIMIESEPKKKSKKELEQERLSFAEAIRLEEQMNEEQRAQIARDEEIARQWDEEERQRAMAEAKTSKKIDWNDPSVIRYHTLKMKPKTVAQARKNMIKYLKNQGNYKISDFKGMSYDEIRPIFEKV
ncbi:hypothetical protein Tco_0981729, partial [Tanacetum coccineum]